MELYLISPGEIDPATGGHTSNGSAQARKAALFAQRLAVAVGEIRHSPDPASTQTAHEFEQHLSTQRVETTGMGADDDINPLRREAAGIQQNIVVISNPAYLVRIAGALLAQNESMPVAVFYPGSVVRLDRRDDALWSLQLVVPVGVMP